MAWTSRAMLVAYSLLVAACAGNPDATECATGITCPAGTKCAAVQPICITNDCGDGIQQSTEKCDDGNIIDGDGCSANCQSTEVCGDKVLNSAAGEVCDDGNTTGGDGCAADCRSIEICGNGIRDVTEACDDGNTVPGDGCSGNCKSTEVCGNGIVDINEKCDDAGAPGGCNDDCQGGTGCGDGAIDKDGNGNPLEECDDGNSDDQDDCTNDCKLNICGDGIVQTSGARVEECDPFVGFGETADCNIDCTLQSCGDGKLNNTAGEECDDGAGMNGDDRDCTSSCKINVCGDGLWNMLGPDHIEECDDGNLFQNDGCTTLCTTMPVCGNGVLEGTEACDDANTTNGDGCSSDCQFESCGDGIKNNGEECDPGPAIETEDCNSDCTMARCGDLRVNAAAHEECDLGDGMNGDDKACTSACKINVCGDGRVGPGEQCDDGNDDNDDGCSTSCTTPLCGNGIVDGATMTQPAEECDDGNTNDNDGCLTTCKYNTCGDGKRNPATEECDNGPANNWNGDCLPTCVTNKCGDGHQDTEGNGPSETEACDDGNNADESACPYGIQSCTLCAMGCDAVENLTGNVCGDGVVDPMNEVCDDHNTLDETECPYGVMSCTACSANCQVQLSLSGSYCGDGVVDDMFGEGCDDHNANACGTCDEACNVFASTVASGYIVVPPGSEIGSTETFTLDDGFGRRVTFEFDTDNNVQPGNIRVPFQQTDTASDVRMAMRNAINSPAANIGITATTMGGGSTLLLLTNDRASALGNQTITETVSSNQFVVSGMSGGAGGDCLAGIGCNVNDDCRSGDCDTGAHVCRCASDDDCATGTCAGNGTCM